MIRKIEQNDIQTCADILKDAYSRFPYNEVFKEKNANKYILEKYSSCKDNSFVFIDDNKKIVAFIILKISSWTNGPQAILEEIVVSPSLQNSGIGKELVSYSYNYLDSLGIKSIMLWAKNNDRLLNFYKKQGFYLTDDFVVMFKNIG